jgi:hypothetical protein
MGQAVKTISVDLEPSFSTKPKKGGRPRKEIAQHTFERLCEVQATLEEIAHVLDVSEDTVECWCKRTYELGFADTYKKFSANGKTSLRRYQFEAAKKGNPTMLIWLGKQYLGQREPLATIRGGDIDVPVTRRELTQMLAASLGEQLTLTET